MLKPLRLAFLLFWLVDSASGNSSSFQSDYPADTIQALIARSTSFNGKDPDSIRFYAQKAIALTESHGLDSLQARAETNIGVSFLYKRDYDSALHFFERSLEKCRVAEDSLQMARNLSNMGIIYYHQAAYEKALTNFLESVKIQERNSSQNLSSIYTNIGAVLHEQSNYEQAKKYYLLAYQHLQPNSQVSYALSNLADLHYSMEAYDSCLHYADIAIDYYQKRNFGMGLAFTYRHKGQALIKLDRLKEAEEVLAKSTEFLETKKITSELGFNYVLMAELAMKRDQYTQVIQFAETALQHSNSYTTRKDVYDLHHRAYQKLGNFQSALTAHEQLVTLKDSLQGAEENKHLSELHTQYETEKKEAQIMSLQQQSQIQELQISQQRMWLYSGLVGAVLLLLLGWVAYRQLRLRKRQDELKLQQKLLRVQMNPHFLYNALNAIQKLIYWNDDRKKTADCLAQFSQLTRQILEFNQHEFISLEQELSFIENYLEVQRMRYDPPFTYEIEVDDSLEIDELRIPPMITQPFLENAIEHGLAHKSEPGHLLLKINQQQGQLQIVIEDNGVGIATATTLTDTAPHQSLATTITQNRLLMLRKSLKKKAELWIQDLREEGQASGTRVNFSLPMIYG